MSKKYSDYDSWEELRDYMFTKVSNLGVSKNDKKEFYKWFDERECVGLHFDFYMLARLFLVYKKKLQKEDDYVMVIIGREGSGKSTLGIQVGAFVDPHYTVNHICMDDGEFITQLKGMYPGKAMQLDEGAMAVMGSESMTTKGRNMIKLFMNIRVKRGFYTICIPAYKKLDKYIREDRVALIVNITDRGRYTAYFGDAIRIINEMIPKMHKVSAIKVPNGFFWQGRFSKELPYSLDRAEYMKKKDKFVDGFIAQVEKEKDKEPEPLALPISQVAERLGVTSKAIQLRIYKKTIRAHQIGTRWFVPKEELDRLSGKRMDLPTISLPV